MNIKSLTNEIRQNPDNSILMYNDIEDDDKRVGHIQYYAPDSVRVFPLKGYSENNYITLTLDRFLNAYNTGEISITNTNKTPSQIARDRVKGMLGIIQSDGADYIYRNFPKFDPTAFDPDDPQNIKDENKIIKNMAIYQDNNSGKITIVVNPKNENRETVYLSPEDFLEQLNEGAFTFIVDANIEKASSRKSFLKKFSKKVVNRGTLLRKRRVKRLGFSI